jgi:hypothetical protein
MVSQCGVLAGQAAGWSNRLLQAGLLQAGLLQAGLLQAGLSGYGAFAGAALS